MTDPDLDALLEKAEIADTRGFDAVRVPKEDMFDLILALREARAERDKLDNLAGVRGNMLRYIAFVAGGDESSDPQLGVDRLKACLEQAEAEVARLRAENERLTKAVRPMCQSRHPVDHWCCERQDGHREAHGAFLNKSASHPSVYWEDESAAMKATGGQP